LYFDAAVGPSGSETPELVCQSKALFQWKQWLADHNSLVGVWLAVADNIGFNYNGRLTVDATVNDVVLPGGNAKRKLDKQVKQLVELRKHVRKLSEEFRLKWEKFLRSAVELLFEARTIGIKFDVLDPHWKGTLMKNPEVLHVADKLDKLGPEVYTKLNSPALFNEALDNLLDFATSSYCTLCCNPAPPTKRVSGRNTQVVVAVDKARNLPWDTGSFYAMVKVGENKLKGSSKSAETGVGDVVWDSPQGRKRFTFNGKDQRLEASTWIELTLYKKEGVFKSHKPVGRWKQRLINIVGRQGNFEWLELEPVEGGSYVRGLDDAPVELYASLKVEHVADVISSHAQQILPRGCGVAYAVQQLIEQNMERLRRVEAQLQLVDRKVVEISDGVHAQEFAEKPWQDLAVEKFIPDIAFAPPRADIEGAMHDEVFGGIFSESGPSVGLFNETNGDHFYAGPKMFDAYVKLSRPSIFEELSLRRSSVVH
jgi:hypothetical protein